MPNHKSCKKRMKSSEKANEKNRQVKSRIKNVIRNVRNAKDSESAAEALKKAYSILDRAVQARVIHRNKAANQKSELSAHIHKTVK